MGIFDRTGSGEKRRQRTVWSRVNALLEHLFLVSKSENNYVKLNADRHCSRCHIAGTLVSGNMNCGCSEGFSRKEVSNDIGVTRQPTCCCGMRLRIAEVYSLCA